MILFHTHMIAICHVLQKWNLNSMAVDAATYWLFSSVHHTKMAVVWISDVTKRSASALQLLQFWCSRRSLRAKYVSRSVLWKWQLTKGSTVISGCDVSVRWLSVAFVRRHLPEVGCVGRITRSYQMQQLQRSGSMCQSRGLAELGTANVIRTTSN